MKQSFYCLRRNELTGFESYYSYRYFSSSQVVRGSYLNTYLQRSKHRFSSPLLYAYPGISPQRRRARSFEVIAQSWNLDSLFSCQGTYPHNVRNERGCFLGSCRKFFLSTYSDWERPFQQVFSKKFCSPKEQPARKFEMCGFQGIIFSSLIPTERGRLGSHSQKNFLPSKSRQREASFFTPVLNIPSLVPTGSGQKLCLFCNFLPSRGRSRERLKIKPFEKIYFSSLNRQATRMIKNRAFAVNIFLPQVVEHENADFMNGFRNFRKIPSRGGAREREKYKVFSNNFFLPRDRA